MFDLTTISTFSVSSKTKYNNDSVVIFRGFNISSLVLLWNPQPDPFRQHPTSREYSRQGVTKARLASLRWRFHSLVFYIVWLNFIGVTKKQFRDAKHGNCIDRKGDSPLLQSRRLPQAVAAALTGRDAGTVFSNSLRLVTVWLANPERAPRLQTSPWWRNT